MKKGNLVFIQNVSALYYFYHSTQSTKSLDDILCAYGGQRTVKGLVRFNQQRGSSHRRYIE